jgi:hypothetical protein
MLEVGGGISIKQKMEKNKERMIKKVWGLGRG